MSFPNNPGPPESSGPDNTSELRDDLSILGEGDTPEDRQDKDEDKEPPETLKPEEDEEEKEEKEEKEDEEEKEEEKEEEEEDEEEDKELTSQTHPRPTVKQIKALYPDFFKKFPEMRHMLFREQEYSTLFPTVDDAKEASSRARDFDMFSGLLQSGKREDFGEFLKGVSEAGPETLRSMSVNFLPSLYNTNKDLYFEITTPVAEGLLKNAFKAGRAAGNTNLENAALHIAQWALGDAQYASGEKSTPPPEAVTEKKDPKLEEERQQFYMEKHNDAQQYIASNSSKRLEREIRKGLDPNGVFNEFTTKLLLDQIRREIGDQLEADKKHMETMNSMWQKAHKAGYAGDWKDRIMTTYLSRARAIMPAIRTKIRNEALNGLESRNSRVRDLAGKSGDRRDVQGSQNAPRSVSQRGAVPAGKKIDWSKTSDLDFLNDNVKFR